MQLREADYGCDTMSERRERPAAVAACDGGPCNAARELASRKFAGVPGSGLSCRVTPRKRQFAAAMLNLI
jgi:hypothetical protein